MDVTTLRKSYTGITPAVIRPSTPAAREGVQTEMAPVSTVMATDQAGESETSPNQYGHRLTQAAAEMRRFIDRRNIVDGRTREVVYQAVNTSTGEVVRQTPSEVTLKLRAYRQEEEEASQSTYSKVA